MRPASRVLAAAAILATGCNHRTRVIEGPQPSPRVTVETVLRPGQTAVHGTVSRLSADAAVAPPLTTPLIVTAPNRGVGELRVTKALVGGKRASIVWNAGQPLPINGKGSLDVAPAPVGVTSDGIRWHLDGATRALGPGRYSMGAPVAVGTGGLAQPREGVEFLADAETAITTSGDAGVSLPAQPLTLDGPGAVSVEGALRVQTPTRSHRSSSIRFGAGAYHVVLTPVAGGYTIEGLFQGPVL